MIVDKMDYHITSLQHPLVKHLVKLRKKSSHRHESHSLLIEGIKPIEEIARYVPAKVILTSRHSIFSKNLQSDRLLFVPEEILHKISGMVNPEGILAEFPIPSESHLKGISRLLVLDQIQDPGNLGTLLRTALALGWEGVFIVGKGCDLFNEKVLRAARGAHFYLPFRHGNWVELKNLAIENNMTPLLADIEGLSPHKIKLAQKILLILSHEAHGPSADALSWCERITIPMSGNMESLNVSTAGAILMYVLQQRLQNDQR